MSTEPRLTVAVWRYEIMVPRDEVQRRLIESFGNRTIASFFASFADVYDGDPPIPEAILHREVSIDIVSLTWTRLGLRAFGYNPERRAFAVSILIPRDREARATLQLMDDRSSMINSDTD